MASVSEITRQNLLLRQELSNVSTKIDRMAMRNDGLMTHMERLAGIAVTVPVKTGVYASNIKASDKALATRNLIPGFCYSCIKILVQANDRQEMVVSSPVDRIIRM